MGYKKMLQERRERERAQAAQKAQADTEIITADTESIVLPYSSVFPQTEFQALFEGIEDF